MCLSCVPVLCACPVPVVQASGRWTNETEFPLCSFPSFQLQTAFHNKSSLPSLFVVLFYFYFFLFLFLFFQPPTHLLQALFFHHHSPFAYEPPFATVSFLIPLPPFLICFFILHLFSHFFHSCFFLHKLTQPDCIISHSIATFQTTGDSTLPHFTHHEQRRTHADAQPEAGARYASSPNEPWVQPPSSANPSPSPTPSL